MPVPPTPNQNYTPIAGNLHPTGDGQIVNVMRAVRLSHDLSHHASLTADADGGLVIASTGPDTVFETDVSVANPGNADSRLRILAANGANNAVLQMDSDGNATTFTVVSTGALTIQSNSVTFNAELLLSPNGAGIVLKSPDGTQTKKLRLSNAGALELVTP